MTDEILGMIAGERRRVADLLDGLTAEQWATPSLCDGWTVRDVAAHLTAGWNIPKARFAREMLRRRGFDAANEHLARGLARRPVEEIVTDLRTHADDPFSPPLVGIVGQLADVVTHGQDIARPLGIEHRVEPATVRPALDMAVSRFARFVSPTRHREGVRFVCADQDWNHGDGPMATGDSVSVLLALLGRAAGAATLSGPGADTVLRRLR